MVYKTRFKTILSTLGNVQQPHKFGCKSPYNCNLSVATPRGEKYAFCSLNLPVTFGIHGSSCPILPSNINETNK